MASYGAKRPMWAPFDGEEPIAEMPAYGAAISLGKMIKSDVSITNASGEIYADDTVAEKVDEFASGAIALETDDLLLENAAQIYGSTYDNATKTLTDEVGDNIPYGGYTFYRTLMRNGTKVYQSHFYPKTKAAHGNDTIATKGSSVTFGSTPIPLTVLATNTGQWRKRAEFTTEAAAIAWCDEQLAGESTPEA